MPSLDSRGPLLARSGVDDAPALRIATVYLGRRGAGGPIAFNLAQALRPLAEVLPVVSAYALHGPDWRAAWKGEFIATPTYRNALEAAFSILSGVPIRALARRIAAWHPDVLLFPMFHPWNGRLQRLLPDIPAVVMVHDPLPHPDLEGKIFEALENLSLRRAARVIVWSERFVESARRRTTVPVTAVPLGEMRYERLFHAPPSPPPPYPYLLFFGRIVPYKGLDVLLEAFAQLAPKFPDLRLRIVGSGSLKRYRRQMRDLPNLEVVNRWVEDEEIAHHFRHAAVVVLPYTSATQSGVVPLAAAFARPVVATMTGGIPEQIVDGETGLLVPPSDARALAAAVEELLTCPQCARRVGKALQHAYRSNFRWENTAVRVLEVCRAAVRFSK